MTPSGAPTRLARLLGHDDLRWLLDRLRSRLERGQPLTGTVSLDDPTPPQRAALERLLGRRPRAAGSLTVPLARVGAVLIESGAWTTGLETAVVELTGPLVIRAEAEQREHDAWARACRPLESVVATTPALQGWYTRLRDGGVLRRLVHSPEAAAPLLEALVLVIAHLPAAGEALGRFAARLLGDAHALDDGRPLSTLTLGAARALTGLPDTTVPRDAVARRETWAAVGLLRDELSSTVLTLGLPGETVTASGRMLAALAESGEPAVLTLRQLVRQPPRFALPGRRVFVCENPVVVAAAAGQCGSASAPVVCTSGQPGAAALHLLRALVTAGATLHYHGDFDWGGITIANLMTERLDVRPWRYTAADYRAALATAPGGTLSGRPVEARWDGKLADQMTRHGIKIEEELVLDALLADLAG